MTKKLSEKRLQYCRERLTKNATDAYLAVYGRKCSRITASANAAKLEADPRIIAEITRLQDGANRVAVDVSGIDKARVLKRWYSLAFTDLPGIVTWDSKVMTIEDFQNLNADQRACIREFEVFDSPDGGRRVKVKLHDTVKALENLTRIAGMYEVDNAQQVPAQFNINLAGKPK